MTAPLASRAISPDIITPAKPCPFCGGDPGLARIVGRVYLVGCDEDDCPSHPQTSGTTLREAWDKWNTRASIP